MCHEVTTVGNNSFIKLRLKNKPGDESQKILETIHKFETEHKNLEVLAWYIQQTFSVNPLTGRITDSVEGIWMRHRSKK